MNKIEEFFSGCPSDAYDRRDPYFIFREKLSNPTKQIRFCPEIEELRMIHSMLRGHSYVNMIPVYDYTGYLYGYVLRSPYNEDKRFQVIQFNQFMTYGFEDFKDYKLGSPLLLCEGVKDDLALKVAYPYSLSYLGSFPTGPQLSMFKKMSGKIAIVGDNDNTSRWVERKSRENGFLYFRSILGKDLGSMLEQGEYILIREFIKAILSSM